MFRIRCIVFLFYSYSFRYRVWFCFKRLLRTLLMAVPSHFLATLSSVKKIEHVAWYPSSTPSRVCEMFFLWGALLVSLLHEQKSNISFLSQYLLPPLPPLLLRSTIPTTTSTSAFTAITPFGYLSVHSRRPCCLTPDDAT